MATRKKPPVMTECEVNVRGRWLPCTLYEALTERGEMMRCKYCHGPVQALKEVQHRFPSPHRTPAKPPRLQISGQQILRSEIQTPTRFGIDRSRKRACRTFEA